MKHLTERIVAAMFVIAALSFQSCKKDDGYSFLLVERGAFVDAPGERTSVGFTSTNIVSVSATTVPQGWTITPDMSDRRIYVTAPTTFDTDTDDEEANVRYGTAIVTGYSSSGSGVAVSLYVSIAEAEDLTDERSNCYIIDRSNGRYCIDVTRQGENGQTIEPASVAILWETPYKVIEYPKLVDGKAYFFHAVGTDDDGEEYFVNGNAVLGAFDSAGTLLWSWHLWCAEFDPDEEQTELGGEVAMLRNLGAGAISGTSEEDILASYGLYYQWGRKEPFVGPAYYNMADSADAAIYDSQNLRVYIDYTGSNDESGTIGYARKNALTYVTGVKDTDYNWLQAADTSLWGEQKTVNDPCPKGWKIPTKEFFAALSIKDAIEPELASAYGFTLTDGVHDAFFPGAGRRSFYTGALTNMNDNQTRPAPWIGCYWSATGEGRRAYAMDFSFDIYGTRAGSSFQGAALQYAAGGMQIRCVKIR